MLLKTLFILSIFYLSHIQDVPKYFELYEKIKKSEKKNKLIIVQEPVYNDDGSDAVSEISQDNKDR
jgi:hypothetical protein